MVEQLVESKIDECWFEQRMRMEMDDVFWTSWWMNYFAIVKEVFNVIIVIFFHFEYIEFNTDTNSFYPIIEMNLLVERSFIGSKMDECWVEQRVHIDGCKWMM